MARLPALVTEYARLDGRPRKTIDWYARLARQAGKLPTTKRGLGAAHMGVREAVNLILACNGAEDPKEGANAIEKYRPFVPYLYGGAGSSDKEQLDELEDEDMREIGLQPNLGAALENVIRLTPSLFSTFDDNLKFLKPKLSAEKRFFEIKHSQGKFFTIENDFAGISIGDVRFHDYDPYHFNKNYLRTCYCKDPNNPAFFSFLHARKFRENEISLGFGFFLGLAKLLFEDSMQFPDELLPQSKGGGGDG